LVTDYPQLLQPPYNDYTFPAASKVEEMLTFYYEKTSTPNIDHYRTMVMCLHQTRANLLRALDQLRKTKKDLSEIGIQQITISMEERDHVVGEGLMLQKLYDEANMAYKKAKEGISRLQDEPFQREGIDDMDKLLQVNKALIAELQHYKSVQICDGKPYSKEQLELFESCFEDMEAYCPQLGENLGLKS
jgi:hypothetical protein